MPATYESISTTTLGSNTTTVTFSSIPSTYTDLILIAQYSNTTSVDMLLRFNGITTSVYSDTHIYGNGTSPLSYRQSNAGAALLDLGAGGMGTSTGTSFIHVMNYANTNINKAFLTRSSFSAIHTGATVGLWRSTAAINQIDISASTANTIASGGVFTLYGIKAA